MSQNNLSHYIPRRLDDTGKFLFWELDVAIFGIMGLCLGIILKHTFIGLGVGILLAYGYSKSKTGRHPGRASHLAYWCIGLPKMKELPGSHLRELNG